MIMTKVLVIDNYDSFTYNLVHYLEDLDCEVSGIASGRRASHPPGGSRGTSARCLPNWSCAMVASYRISYPVVLPANCAAGEKLCRRVLIRQALPAYRLRSVGYMQRRSTTAILCFKDYSWNGRNIWDR